MILGKGTPWYGHCFEEIDAACTELEHVRAGIEGRAPRVIVFNEKHRTGEGWEPPPGSVIFNLENVPGQVQPERWRAHVEAGGEVWDSTARNVARYPEGFPVTHVPMGYHPSMFRFRRLPPEERDIDVVFCGALNARRSALLDDLSGRGLCVVHLGYDAPFGAGRDYVLRRAKLALDCLFYEDGIFSQLRALHLVSNGVPVFAEEAPEMPEWVRLHAPYAQLAACIHATLRSGRPPGASATKTLDGIAAISLEHLKKTPLSLPEPHAKEGTP